MERMVDPVRSSALVLAEPPSRDAARLNAVEVPLHIHRSRLAAPDRLRMLLAVAIPAALVRLEGEAEAAANLPMRVLGIGLVEVLACIRPSLLGVREPPLSFEAGDATAVAIASVRA